MQNTTDPHESGEECITAEFWGERGTFVTVGLGQPRVFHHLQLCSGILHPSCDWVGRSWWLWEEAAEMLTAVLI